MEDENKPSETLTLAEMLKKLMKLKLSNKEDHRKLGERIAMIQGGYMCKVDENQRLAGAVNAGRRDYADIICQETIICNISKNEKMTAKRLIKAMQQNFRPKGGADSDEDNDSDKGTALMTGAF